MFKTLAFSWTRFRTVGFPQSGSSERLNQTQSTVIQAEIAIPV
jgi:hypothetical protein